MIKYNMIINISHRIILVFLIVFYGTLLGQDNQEDVVLTMEKAINIALGTNYDIQLSGLELLKTEALIDEAYAGAFPKINFSGQYLRNIKSPVLFIPPNTPFNPGSQTLAFSIGADNSYNLSLTLNQTIFDPRLGSAITIAKDYSQYTKHVAESNKDDVIAQVKKAYYNVLLAKRLVEVAQQNYDLAKANYENTGLWYKQGLISEFDYLRSEVQLANVEPALIAVKNALELAKNNLKNLLSFDLSTEIVVLGELIVEEISPDLLERSNELLMERNQLLQSLSVQQRMLEENINIESADYWPTLSLFGNYNWQTQDNTFNFSNYLWANTFTVGLQLTYPVFDGFKRKVKVEQATIDVKSIGITRTKTEEGLKVGLLQSKLKMGEALDRIEAQQKTVSQAERALHIAQTRYQNGVGTQLEILDTQNSLIQSQINYEQAVYDFLISKTEWERILGITEN